jgi:hypothetical protein
MHAKCYFSWGRRRRGGEWPEYEFYHLPPSGTIVKNRWIYTFPPSVCIHGGHRKNFTEYRLKSFYVLTSIQEYNFGVSFLLTHFYKINAVMLTQVPFNCSIVKVCSR